jgi:outer membrane lipoprotein-sorting protein
MNFATKMAAVMVVGLASMASAAELTFDDVIKAAEGVKSYQYKETISSKNHPPVTNQWFFKEPGITRTEYGNGVVGIDARARNKILMIDPSRKTATLLIQMKDRPPYQIETDGSSILAGRMRGWKKLFDKQESLGETIVDGRKAVGFRFSRKNGEITLWVDPETKLPFKEEMWAIRDDPFSPTKEEDKRVSFDYVYNPKLDDSLFSLTPPEGYKVEEREVMMSPPTEKDFTQGLKVCAELNENQFPDELTMTYLMEFVTNEKQDQVVYMLTFAREQHQEKHDWRYVGQGVKLGEKDKPVYWYQPEAGKPYRVVYGDLSLRDVDKDKLPAIQPATQATTKPAAKKTIRKKSCCQP